MNPLSADCSLVRGFNYQPSYGRTGFDLWQRFDPAAVDRELGLGKTYFPEMNAIRLWLSWTSFKFGPDEFEARFEAALTLASKHGLAVMPVLFNRWHDSCIDYGGIYIDHFLPGAGWVQGPDMFKPFLERVVGGHASDERIFAWDLCNEPFAYGVSPDQVPEIARSEAAWLESVHAECKRLGAAAPITVGTHQAEGVRGLGRVAHICDVLSIHPYWMPGRPKADFEELLDEYAAFASGAGKGLVASETCWGSVDDAERVEIVRYTLSQLKSRGVGWLAYLLHHSLIPDAHRAEYGPLGGPGNLSFIEADGRLRPGHGVFNEF